jgi:hypothetical protein
MDHLPRLFTKAFSSVARFVGVAARDPVRHHLLLRVSRPEGPGCVIGVCGNPVVVRPEGVAA